VPVSKDVDAALALTLNQVDAALTTPGSLQVLMRINPSGASTLREVYKSPKILRPPLCLLSDKIPPERRKRVIDAIKNMADDAQGKQAMQAMGFNGWMVFEQWMLKK
jgi:ABC-type phosphate/phosphonate transport system substrate-binding protein